MIVDLWKVNKVLEKVKEMNKNVCYRQIVIKEDLQIVGIGDALSKADEKAIGGVILLLANRNSAKAAPLYCMSYVKTER